MVVYSLFNTETFHSHIISSGTDSLPVNKEVPPLVLLHCSKGRGEGVHMASQVLKCNNVLNVELWHPLTFSRLLLLIDRSPTHQCRAALFLSNCKLKENLLR